MQDALLDSPVLHHYNRLNRGVPLGESVTLSSSAIQKALPLKDDYAREGKQWRILWLADWLALPPA